MEQVPDWALVMQSFGWENAGQITLAAILGGIIGIEREWRGRSAGFRTNILIALGSCLFTILSIEGFPLGDSNARDSARIAAQIVSGVGFLGAGALIQTRHRTKGMTTAATIWLVAAIGMAVGTGAYFLAIFTTLLTAAVLQLLLPVSRLVEHERRVHKHDDDDDDFD
ncbi:MAG TPA: MgtC/SapB family protein [Candidatus Sulfomarinibacteraceae bacterium]|nr:MgtC/SapB family protein [Candidatus Sulfomarinibacteraceae bacterium]